MNGVDRSDQILVNLDETTTNERGKISTCVVPAITYNASNLARFFRGHQEEQVCLAYHLTTGHNP